MIRAPTTMVQPWPPRTPRELFLIDEQPRIPSVLRASGVDRHVQGQPTNAIFGFASMLVKIISEYEVKPTLVVWDAGMSGREEVYGEYKSHRDERPDLLAEQWPHMQPLVDCFGREPQGAGLRGRRRDRHLRAVQRAPRASRPWSSGDRDLFQLIEPGVGDGHEPRRDRDQGLRPGGRDRSLRHPAGADPRLSCRATIDRHIPGVPDRREDRVAAVAGVRRPRGVLASVDRSQAPSASRTSRSTPRMRVSKLQPRPSDIELDVDLDRLVTREPDRSRLWRPSASSSQGPARTARGGAQDGRRRPAERARRGRAGRAARGAAGAWRPRRRAGGHRRPAPGRIAGRRGCCQGRRGFRAAARRVRAVPDDVEAAGDILEATGDGLEAAGNDLDAAGHDLEADEDLAAGRASRGGSGASETGHARPRLRHPWAAHIRGVGGHERLVAEAEALAASRLPAASGR